MGGTCRVTPATHTYSHSYCLWAHGSFHSKNKMEIAELLGFFNSIYTIVPVRISLPEITENPASNCLQLWESLFLLLIKKSVLVWAPGWQVQWFSNAVVDSDSPQLTSVLPAKYWLCSRARSPPAPAEYKAVRSSSKSPSYLIQKRPIAAEKPFFSSRHFSVSSPRPPPPPPPTPCVLLTRVRTLQHSQTHPGQGTKLGLAPDWPLQWNGSQGLLTHSWCNLICSLSQKAFRHFSIGLHLWSPGL